MPIDIRLICATNVPLSELANENRFRKDLIYRINTVEIMVPPLRKREEDIILLARHFDRIYTNKYMKPLHDFDAKAMEKLKIVSFSRECAGAAVYDRAGGDHGRRGCVAGKGPDLFADRVGGAGAGRAAGMI